MIAPATLWLLKYVESTWVIGRRGTVTVTVSAQGPHEHALFALLAARGFAMQSRQIELAPDGGARVVCSGRYNGAYPDWSSDLVRALAAQQGVNRVELRRNQCQSPCCPVCQP